MWERGDGPLRPLGMVPFLAAYQEAEGVEGAQMGIGENSCRLALLYLLARGI